MSGKRSGERGLSLAEVLVAVTVLTIAATVAMFLYDVARRSFKKGENATEQQQAVRIGFDKLSSDVRLANFNANPDGDAEDVDEGIEAAYDTALVIRADYDAEDAAEAQVPETALAGAARRAVSVGNDEIVAYVLAKPDGSSADTLFFDADVKDSPRDGVVERVAIPNVALVQDDPPYTLYRVTLLDPGTWGSGSFVNRATMIDNVRSLKFRYAGVGGALSAPQGTDTPAARRTRAMIRQVDIELEGLTRDPDLSWQDPRDSNPVTRSFRKFVLRGTITPRNLGKKGLVDPGWDATPPQSPTGPGGGDLLVVPGHCLGLYVLWAPNPPSDGVVAYRLNWTSPGLQPGHRMTGANGLYLGGLGNGLPYTVTVQAIDAAGNASPPSNGVSATTVDLNFPQAPNGPAQGSSDAVAVSTDLADGVHIFWESVTQNTESVPSDDPDKPMIRDLEGYQIWRGPNDLYVRTDSGVVLVADERMIGPQPAPTYIDADVAACRDYYYQVVAVDYCDKSNDSGAHTLGRRLPTAPPAPPNGVAAVFASADTVRLTWEPVTRDTGGAPLLVDAYDVDRCIGPPGCSSYGPAGTVQGDTSFIDTVSLGPNEAVYYRVKALTDCGAPYHESAFSEIATPPTCTFPGQVKIARPDNPHGNFVTPPVQIEVQVVGSIDTYSKVILDLRNELDGSLETVELPAGPGPWPYNWTPPVNGKYLIKATVSKDLGMTCTSFATKRVTVRP